MNFYQELILDIKDLIEKDKIEQALLKINNELSMPYVPSDIEKELNNLKMDIYEIISPKIKKSESINADYIFELLNSIDKEQQAIGLNYLNKINLRDNINNVNILLKSSNLDNSIKNLILFTLNEQEINKEFVVLIKDKEFVMNPMEIDFDNAFVFINKIDEIISNSIENENPGIAFDAKLLNINYYLNNFYKFELNNINEKAAAFILFAIELLDEQKEFNYLEQWFNFDEEIAKNFLKELKNNGQ